MIYAHYIKPILDRLAAFLFILLLWPFWMVLYCLLYATQGRPVLFRQARTGWQMQGIQLYKIRTLQTSNRTDLSLHGRAYTFCGKWLRTTGIDEVPQLIHILKGEMSFIGPRALPEAYESHYSEYEKGRFYCLPGITGWAQVHGRNNISWSRRFELDIWYKDHIGFWLDVTIVIRTFTQYLQSRKEETPMPVFEGTDFV